MQTKTKGRDEPFMYSKKAVSSAENVNSAPAASPASQTNAPLASPRLINLDRLPMRKEGSKTAIILHDTQYNVMIDGGAFAGTGSLVHARQQNLIIDSARLPNAAHAKGVMFIHVWIVLETGAPYLAQHASFTQGLKKEKALVRGTWGVLPAAGWQPHR